ncbi:unnamed protein product [Orchesella dallaii]|uniref:Uncharacterized protein n=1 Tax=Orchesella dallaii TaxID=48710 RepID=A0ABP1Q6P6_9HEXA
MKRILAGETFTRTSTSASHPQDDEEDDDDYVKRLKAENLLKVEFKKLVKMEESSNNSGCSGAGPRVGGKRRHYRRPKKEHDAIDILRRVVVVIAVIELMLALSESSLMSTFFLFLTMSTTFDVKPENVIDTYCYREPGGNRMCEDYMRRSTGYSPSTMHHYRAASTNSRSYYNYNFPNVAPSVEDQSYELFLAFNQTLFDDPAKFNLQLELDSASRNETLVKILQLYLAEMEKSSTSDMNRTNNNDKPAVSIKNQKMKLLTSLLESYFAEHLKKSVEILRPFPSLATSKVPQVMDAMRRAKLRTQQHQNQNRVKAGNKVSSGPAPELKREEFDKLAYHLPPTPASPLSSSSHLHGSRYKANNMIENKDFILHRWKRQSQGGIITPHTPVADDDATSKQPIQKVFQGRLNRQELQVGEEEGKLTEPKIKGTQGTPHKQVEEKGFSLGANGNEQQSNVNRELMKEKKQETVAPTIQTSVKAGGKEEMQQNHDHNIADGEHHHPTLILDTEPSPISITAFSSTSSPPPSTKTEHKFTKVEDGNDEIEAFKKYMKEHLAPARTDSEKKISMESYLTLAMMNRNMVDSDAILKKMRNQLKEQMTQQRPKSEHQQGSSSPTKKKNTRLSSKYLQELYTKLGKSPRHILALMEASLFNNWDCFMGVTKIVYRNHGGKAAPSSCMECFAADKDFVPDFPSSEATRMEIMQNLSLSMVMDVFHPHTYQTAERRKRAMQQVYHDYSSTLMMVLTDLKDLPVSHSFYKVFMVIKMYTFVWHLVLFFVLIIGCLMEDKTALNIWGIFAILTSFLHFIIEEWIDTNFEPDKTGACIWFSIIFRVYKPVAVLIVLTLSSEILKRDGSSPSSSKQRGLSLFELIRGKKLGKKQSDKVSDGSGGGDGYPPSVTVTKMQFRRAELENGKIVYTNLSPSKTGLYTRATCVICGATAKFAKHRATSGGVGDPTVPPANPDGVENINENGKNNFIKHGLQCSCTKATILGPNEIFDVSDDDDEEDEDGEEQELEIVGDEEDDDTDEEDGYDYEQEKQEEDPIMNVDQELRQSNKNGRKKHAPMVVILSEGKKYGMKKKDESEGRMGKQGTFQPVQISPVLELLSWVKMGVEMKI